MASLSVTRHLSNKTLLTTTADQYPPTSLLLMSAGTPTFKREDHPFPASAFLGAIEPLYHYFRRRNSK